VEQPSLRERAAQALRLSNELARAADRDELLKLAIELTEQADAEDAAKLSPPP
jgi:hypothetical protein